MSEKILSLGNIYFQIDSVHFPLGNQVDLNRELVGGEYALYPGSSALNFVRVARSLGLSSVFVGKMGNDIPGQQVSALLNKEGIEFFPIISDVHQTNLAINYVADSTDSLMFVSGDANQSLEKHEVEDKLEELFPDLKYLYLGGTFKLKSLLPALPEIISLAKKHDVKVILDHNRITNVTTEEEKEIVRKVIPDVDFYLPSRDELLELFSVSSMEEAIEKIMSVTKNIVVIKDAENGSIGIQNGEVIKVPAFKVEIHNIVGAGDSFNAGFIRAQEEGLDLEKSLRFANATAALKISQKNLPAYDHVVKLINTR